MVHYFLVKVCESGSVSAPYGPHMFFSFGGGQCVMPSVESPLLQKPCDHLLWPHLDALGTPERLVPHSRGYVLIFSAKNLLCDTDSLLKCRAAVRGRDRGTPLKCLNPHLNLREKRNISFRKYRRNDTFQNLKHTVESNTPLDTVLSKFPRMRREDVDLSHYS